MSARWLFDRLSLSAPLARLIGLFGGERFCAHDYWEARHRSHRGKLSAVGHAQLSDSANAAQYETKRDHVTRAIGKHVSEPQGKTLLDAGCGIGLLTSAFVDLGFSVTGADVSRTGIAEAEAREGRVQFVVSSLERLALSQVFDVVVIVDVLLHVVEQDAWVESLGSLSRHVREGGILVVVDSMQRVDDGKPVHCNWRRLDDISETVLGFGLTLIDHVEFELSHEGSRKDIAIFRR